MCQLNGMKLFDRNHAFDSVAYLDASEYGYGGCVISNKENFSPKDKGKSSSWRELRAFYYMLLSIGNSLKGHNV